MKTLSILILVLMFFSCQKKDSKKTENHIITEQKIVTENVKPESLVLKDTVVYLSGDNDLASIKLTLIPNGTFDFYMSIFPEPMQENESKPDLIISNGIWKGNKKSLLLTFAKREKDTLKLNDLFDSSFKEGNEFNVLDQYTVEIDYSLGKINIWGIGCYKTGE